MLLALNTQCFFDERLIRDTRQQVRLPFGAIAGFHPDAEIVTITRTGLPLRMPRGNVAQQSRALRGQRPARLLDSLQPLENSRVPDRYPTLLIFDSAGWIKMPWFAGAYARLDGRLFGLSKLAPVRRQ